MDRNRQPNWTLVGAVAVAMGLGVMLFMQPDALETALDRRKMIGALVFGGFLTGGGLITLVVPRLGWNVMRVLRMFFLAAVVGIIVLGMALNP
jgi:hypothetical protein